MLPFMMARPEALEPPALGMEHVPRLTPTLESVTAATRAPVSPTARQRVGALL